MEDHWDFYSDPPRRPVIGTFDTYEEAVECAKEKIRGNMDSVDDDPFCVWVSPEPEGRHFDGHAYEAEFKKALDATKARGSLTYADSEVYLSHRTMAENLVRARILGERKGMPGEQNYLHSFRVRDLVSKCHHWDDPEYDVFLAALLHDVVEDGGVSLDELRGMGFTERTVALVDLCSHRAGVENSTERWLLMMARLVEARDDGAWRIKMADLTDNLTQCAGLSAENRRFMVEVKAPLMIRLTEGLGFNKMIFQDSVAPISLLVAETERQRGT